MPIDADTHTQPSALQSGDSCTIFNEPVQIQHLQHTGLETVATKCPRFAPCAQPPRIHMYIIANPLSLAVQSTFMNVWVLATAQKVVFFVIHDNLVALQPYF
jgi:hypothetical protein